MRRLRLRLNSRDEAGVVHPGLVQLLEPETRAAEEFPVFWTRPPSPTGFVGTRFSAWPGCRFQLPPSSWITAEGFFIHSFHAPRRVLT